MPKKQADPKDVYRLGRTVSYLGHFYLVEWCDGKQVHLNAGQGQYEMLFQIHSGANGLINNQWTVFVDNPLLRAW